MEGCVDKVLELLENRRDAELIDLVGLDGEEGCRWGTIHGVIGWVHQMINVFALAGKVGLLDLFVQSKFVEQRECFESLNPVRDV